MESKDISTNVAQIKNTMDLKNVVEVPQQNSQKMEIKGVDVKREEVVKNTIETDSKAMELAQVQEKLIGEYNTLNTKHMMNTQIEQTVEGRIFNFKIPEMNFKKYLRELEINGHKHIIGMSDLSALYLKSLDDLGLGITIANNKLPQLSSTNFFKPGVTNLVLVTDETGNAMNVLFNAYMAQFKEVPGYNTSDGDKMGAMAEFVAWSNVPVNQAVFDPAHPRGNLVHEGPSTAKGGFIYSVGLTLLEETKLSCEGVFVNFWKELNYDPNMPNQLLDPMRRTALRTGNPGYKDVLMWLYNQGQKDRLLFTPIPEQLKIALYTDMFLTGFDMVEGLSQMGKQNVTRFVYDSTAPYTISLNDDRHPDNMTHGSAKPINIIGCSWQQYVEYMNGREPGHDMNYNFVRAWNPIPIKREWLNDPEALVAYIISLAPYPIVNYFVPLAWPAMIDIDTNQGYIQWTTHNGFAEHCSSRVRIDGMNDILLVLVDSVVTDVVDPNIAGYNQLWQIDYAGLQFQILNIFNLPNVGGQATNIKPLLFNALTRWSGMTVTYPTVLIDSWCRIHKWSFYADVFNLVALLTTRNGIMYAGSESFAARLNTECLCNLVPAIRNGQDTGYHMILQTPSFIQRLYTLMGMVRQRGSDFIGSLSGIDFREMMMGKRYGVAALKCYLLEVKRNQVRVVVPYRNMPNFDGELENRRIVFATAFDGLLEYLPELVGEKSLYNSTGIIRYIRPREQPGTFCEAWNQHWTDINEYSGLNDWADIMSEVLKATTYREFVVDTETLGDKFKIVNNGQWVELYPEVSDGNHVDTLLKSFNQSFGRALIKGDADGYGSIMVEYSHITDRGLPWEFYQPYWLLGVWTWNADRDLFLPRPFQLLYNCIPFTGLLYNYQNPLIRVKDYNIPYVKMWDRKKLVYLLSSVSLNAPIPYVNISPPNKLIIVGKDFVNRQGYEEFKK